MPLDTDDWMITPPIDLRDEALPSASLRFNHWYNIENNYDKGYIYVTNNYGEDWYQAGPIYTDISDGWEGAIVNLNEYIGSLDPVFVAFRLTSDNLVVRPGWYIDDVKLIGADTEAPAVPTDLVAEPGLTGINLSWTAADDIDFDRYVVYRSLTSNEGFEQIAESTINSFMDSEVEAGITYYYKVAAKDIVGNVSELSEEASCSVAEISIIFAADFEENDGGFVSGVTAGTANPWEWGIPTSGPNGAKSGEKLWATNLSGNYPMSSDSYIQSQAIELPEDKDALLTFSHWLDMEGSTTLYDYGQVFVSNDDGVTWTNITPVPGQKYGKRVQAWADEEISLAAYKGQEIILRFFFHSDSIIAYTGWYIDDLYIVGIDIAEEDPPTDLDISKSAGAFEDRRANYVDPAEPNFNLKKDGISKYEIIEDKELQNTPMIMGGIPVADGVVTVLETGRSVKVDPVTGKYRMRLSMGSYNLRAEAYGYYPTDVEVTVIENETIRQSFVLEAKPRGTITGRVIDRYYKNPAANALIRLVEDPRVAPVVADEDGYFTIEDILVGTYTLKVVANGFEPGEFKVTVNADDIKDIELGLKRFVGYEDEISYDDGSAENALVLNNAPNGLAVRFTPEQFGKVTGAKVYFWDTSWPSPGGNRIGFTIYGTNENGAPYKVGEPIFMNVERGAWNEIDLSSFGFSTDMDFYISTIQDAAGTSCPGTGIDESGAGDRSYMNLDGEFQLIGSEDIEGALMIRAIVENSVSTPIITNLGEETYTNQDTIVVEGIVGADCKVNVYVNNEIVAYTDSIDKEFAVEVDLLQDENGIMVTAELDGVQTEPSQTVLVIKDKVLPVLEVEEPLDNIKTNKEVVHVIGSASDNIELKKVLVNDNEVEVDELGNFHERVMINAGENVITVKAIDLAGNEVTITRTITVELEAPEITNIEPSEDIELRAGEILTVSFNAPEGGEGYFRLMLPFGLESNEIGIPMTEEEGLYTGTWIVPEEMEADIVEIEVVYISESGYEVTKVADGRITIILDDEGEAPSITNVLPTGDTDLRAGDVLEVSFNAPSGYSGYFRLVLPIEQYNNKLGIEMTEESPGFFRGTYTIPEGIVASNLSVEVLIVGEDGERIPDVAQGKVTIIGDRNDLPVNAVIIDGEAFDMNYLNNSSRAQRKYIEWVNSGGQVYIKLKADTIVNDTGKRVTVEILPEELSYFNARGEMTIYEK
ncbi:MAG: carboxypeptidase regulatory-like domain-containing protein [Tissierellales bacterium]